MAVRAAERGAPARGRGGVADPDLSRDGGAGMPTSAEGVLAALRVLLCSSHLAGPDDLPTLVSAAGGQLGAARTVLYLADYDQLLLVPLAAAEPAAAGVGTTAEPELGLEPIAVDGTLAGRAYSDLAQQASPAGSGRTIWTPVLNGTERVGVLRLDFAADVPVEDELPAACGDVAALLAELVMTRSRYGDAVERARRRVPMTLPAELAWQLLPPLTVVSPAGGGGGGAP